MPTLTQLREAITDNFILTAIKSSFTSLTTKAFMLGDKIIQKHNFLVNSLTANKKEEIEHFKKTLKNDVKCNFEIIRSKWSLAYFLIGLCIVLLGIYIGFSIYNTILLNYFKEPVLFAFLKYLYFTGWVIIGFSCIKKAKLTNFFVLCRNILQKIKGAKENEGLITSFYVILTLLLLFYILIGTTILISKLWAAFCFILVTVLSYTAFLADLDGLGGSLQSHLAFITAIVLLVATGYVFYNYINKAAQSMYAISKKIVFFLPIILAFVLFTVTLEFLQLSALKYTIYPNAILNKAVLYQRIFVYGLSSDLSKSFLFSICVGLIFNIISNINVLFVSSLISNKLIHKRVRILDSLSLCYRNFGAICYFSIFPGFLSSLKSTLTFFDNIINNLGIPVVSYLTSFIVYCIINLINGIELAIGSYNQVNLVVLAYEASKNDKRTISTMFNEKVLSQHHSSLFFNTPRLINILFGTQPNSFFAYFIPRMGYIIKNDSSAFIFPFFLGFQVIVEMILLMGVAVMVQTHHNAASIENIIVNKEEEQEILSSSHVKQ